MPHETPEIEWDIDDSSTLILPDHIFGDGSGRIKIGANSRVDFRRLSLIGHGHSLEIGANCLVRGTSAALSGQWQKIRIGDRFQCSGPILNAVGADLIIGDDVLFSSKISVRTHDMHEILDAETGETLNPPASVIIEDHVWVGEGGKILPGVHIGRDCVIGIGSIVTKNVPQGSIAAGVPARVLRSGVTWRR